MLALQTKKVPDLTCFRPITTVDLIWGTFQMITDNFQSLWFYGKYVMGQGHYSEHKPSVTKISAIKAFLKTAKMVWNFL